MGFQRNSFPLFFLTGHYTSVEEFKSGSMLTRDNFTAPAPGL